MKNRIMHQAEINVVIRPLFVCERYLSRQEIAARSEVLKTRPKCTWEEFQKLMKVMSTIWWRRVGFSLVIAGAEALGEIVRGSLGRPYSFGKTWEIKDKSLNIYSVPKISDQNAISEKLLEVFGTERVAI